MNRYKSLNYYLGYVSYNLYTHIQLKKMIAKHLKENNKNIFLMQFITKINANI